jgi:hypothetical protein
MKVELPVHLIMHHAIMKYEGTEFTHSELQPNKD